MLIELRSSPSDPNNTPNQLFQLFKETLILKPKTRIALVSALITTNKTDAFIITNENRSFTIQIAEWAKFTVSIDTGDYQGKALASEIVNKTRTALASINTELQTLFFPVENTLMTKDQTGFQFQIGYNPIGFTSVAPTTTPSLDTSIQLTSASYSQGARFLTRSRDNASTYNEINSSSLAVNPILPYANSSVSKNFNGVFEVSGLTPYSRGNYIGLQSSIGTPTGSWVMDSVNGYESMGVNHYWDKFDASDIPSGQPNYAYDWVISKSGAGGNDIFYGQVLSTNENQIGVNYTYENPDRGYYDNTFTITKDANDKGNGYIIDNGSIYLPLTTGQEILRETDTTYAIVERQNGDYEIMYNGESLATGDNATKIVAGDSVRWIINALDSATDGNHYPQPQLKRLTGEGGGWRNFIIDADKSIPAYDKDTELYPVVRMDGTLAAGAIGNGGTTDTQASTSFLASDMGLGNSSSTTLWVAGELLYQVGTTTPTGGSGMSVMAVVGTQLIGGTGNLTSVLAVGDGRGGRAYANGMVIGMKGSVSGQTVDITLNAVAGDNYTMAGGTGYTTDEFTFSLMTATSPTQPPHPFQQNGRSTRPGKINVTAILGGGIIGQYTITDPGHGFCIGDKVRVNGGNTDAIMTINQVAEDIHQVVLGVMDTKISPGLWNPLEPQNQGLIDFTSNGTSELGTELNLRPLQYSGELINSTQIESSSNPASNNTSNENIMIDLPQIPIGSRNAIGNTDNHIATIPYTTDLDNVLETHKQHYEPFNMIYHELNNEADLNLNHLECRLTNFDGTIRTDLTHPTQLTFSLIPDYK